MRRSRRDEEPDWMRDGYGEGVGWTEINARSLRRSTGGDLEPEFEEEWGLRSGRRTRPPAPAVSASRALRGLKIYAVSGIVMSLMMIASGSLEVGGFCLAITVAVSLFGYILVRRRCRGWEY